MALLKSLLNISSSMGMGRYAMNVHLRTFATLKDIQMRLKAVKNIGKITKSMKMIASTKLNRAQKTMDSARFFGQTSQKSDGADYISTVEKETANKEANGLEGWKKETLNRFPSKEEVTLIVCSSDRGLCGAIHSSVSKVAKYLAKEMDGQVKIAVLGDKAKPQIVREARKNIQMHFTQVGKQIPTFTDAMVIWQHLKQGIANQDLSKNIIIYNRFISVIAYDTSLVFLPRADEIAQSPKLSLFEGAEGKEIIDNLAEYLATTRLYWALAEGHVAELSSKRTAMENATKNSEEMVMGLTMKYNRTRQAVITNELVDIIVGASAAV